MSDHGDMWSGIFDAGVALLGDWLGTSDGSPGFQFPTPAITPGFGVFGLQDTGVTVSPGTVLAPTIAGAGSMPPGPPPPPNGGSMGNGNCDGPSPVWKKVCGVYKWVYPKRRRRKQLLTRTDAAGLAQLKGIVGCGKTMDTWIATHPG